jgi:hypothetical protein
MLVSRDQNAGQNRDIKIGNRSFQNVSQFKYFGRAQAQNLLSSRLLSINVHIIIYKNNFCLYFCMGVKHGLCLYEKNMD